LSGRGFALSLGLGLAVFRLNGWRLLQHVKFTAHDGGKKALAEASLGNDSITSRLVVNEAAENVDSIAPNM
jgi:hypothetical protein